MGGTNFERVVFVAKIGPRLEETDHLSYGYEVNRDGGIHSNRFLRNY